MGERLSTPGLEGSGQRSMRENEAALADIDRQLHDLDQRTNRGEDVSSEIRKLLERKNRLIKDQGSILRGEM